MFYPDLGTKVPTNHLFVSAVLIMLLDSKSGSHCNRYCANTEWLEASVPDSLSLISNIREEGKLRKVQWRQKIQQCCYLLSVVKDFS